ncbi:hypothetical protein EV379_1184 [Microterricola gilva]|uniref:NIPSNAP protein n=1 Tax=Microterricola gilva TaxID=393267 RepID=A0A4Q8ALP4_9MICO|nr:hypothetical protein [Microterricola gilva]RZU64873.1 hypothetical protein EV379_1184 [Microterricola gilva]
MTERTFQLRHYTTVPEHFDGFVAWWARTLPPLRARHGFAVESAYGIRDRHQFIWVVSHPGDRAAFEAAERRYADAADRAAAFAGIPNWMETMDITFVDAVTTTAQEIDRQEPGEAPQ